MTDMEQQHFGIASALSSYPTDKWEKKDIESANSKAVQRICRFIFNEPKVIEEE